MSVPTDEEIERWPQDSFTARGLVIQFGKQIRDRTQAAIQQPIVYHIGKDNGTLKNITERIAQLEREKAELETQVKQLKEDVDDYRAAWRRIL